ncbi:O-antigen ligase family protein [Flavobacterium silvaticum]|uniref:O-antigen ligase family protein n=1 Tax=Flavobacterium silvaticum TaxID=1852020 RepID=A0A972JKT9_9FLAO|nr:O-antigen ligase family protein [Flavobacterium silvaticum]NMH29472.1 O-antigen ligase family protein [Flavobacterium silvaticum]
MIYEKLKSKYLEWSVYGMVLSYFYNMSVITYSATGNNELRLYDFAGFLLVFHYFRNFALINTYIRSVKVFSALYDFLVYALLTLFFTAISSITSNKLLYIIQSFLYYYHFFIFFLNGVFISILILKPGFIEKITKFSLYLCCAALLVVILQNFGVIPFLWNEEYRRSYLGFMSGTFGPNKIVVGMTCVLILGMSMGLVNEKRIKLNKILLLITIVLCLITLVMSGSRTSYVAGAILLGYFSLREPLSFVYSSIAIFFISIGLATFQPQVIEKAFEVYQGRVEKKINNPDDIQEAKVGDLYEDLGAGRKEIFVKYIGLIAEEFYYIPFGRGFNNRLETRSSAHNMYLSLIYEVGLLGMVFYFRWLCMYLFVKMPHFRKLRVAMQGLTISALVSLFFGEHFYVYRALFGLLGLFLFVMTVMSSPIFLIDEEE